MEPLENIEPQLTRDCEYLLDLINIFNLEDGDKNLNLRVCSNKSTLMYDFKNIKDHIDEQKKIFCSYGLDCSLFDKAVLKKMHVLASYLSSNSEAVVAYCLLRSQLFFEEYDFACEILKQANKKVKECESEAEEERRIKTMLLIKDFYEICLLDTTFINEDNPK